VADWSDVAGLDYSNSDLREYMIGMLKHWITD
jgi:glycosidase